MGTTLWIACCIALIGCGVDVGEIAPKATERAFRDGRIYVVYNGKPTYIDFRVRIVTIIYEGQRIVVPPNMTEEFEPTFQGAVQITADPLPGGTPVDLEFEVWDKGNLTNDRFSDYFGGPLVVDGDVTIELYDDDWAANPFSPFLLRMIPGKYDGIHDYSGD